MKIIKSFVIVAICLGSTMALHAQNAGTQPAKDVKKEVEKTAEAKQPQPPAPVLAPSTTPEFKPQPGTPLPKEAPVQANKQPQQSEDEKSKAKTEAKNVVLDNSAPDNTKNITPEQVNILNGKSERPKNSGAPVQHSAQQKTTQAQPVNQN